MEEWKIETINLTSTGSNNYSKWEQNPIRFENLILAFSKCEPILKSLRSLGISTCCITKAKAQKILNKYNLIGFKITGV